MRDALTNEEAAQEGRRVLILTLMGFSFAAYFLLVIEAVKPDTKADLLLGVFYMFVSFVAFLLAYLIDQYRYLRWLDELAYNLSEVGRFTLLASSVAVLWETEFPDPLKDAISVIAALGWVLNFAILFHLRWCFFAGKPPIWLFRKSR